MCPVNVVMYIDLSNPIRGIRRIPLRYVTVNLLSFEGPVDMSKYFLFTIPGNAGLRAALLSMVDFPSNHVHNPITRHTAKMDSHISTPRLPPPLSPPLWVAQWSITRTFVLSLVECRP